MFRNVHSYKYVLSESDFKNNKTLDITKKVISIRSYSCLLTMMSSLARIVIKKTKKAYIVNFSIIPK